MENTFIVRYRRALRELKEAYRLQYALIDESNDLRTLAYQQAESCEKAILKNRKSGRGFLISRLRECLDEQPHAWAITQHLKRDIEEMEANGYDSEVDNEQNRSLYYVIDDAIVVLLDVLGSQYPNKLTTMGIATYRGIIPLSEIILKFGSVPLQRIVKQRLQSATCNITPSSKSAQPLDTPAATTITAPSQAVIPVANLTPDQTHAAFDLRWDEVQNIVNISYSTPEDDALITIYNVPEKGHLAGGSGLWCPMQTAGAPPQKWLDYGARKREAIRLGFARGLCNACRIPNLKTLTEWIDLRDDIISKIFKIEFNGITGEARRTGDFAKGQAEIEKILKIIYEAGQYIPYHPNFENTFSAYLEHVPLSGMNDFLAGFSERNGLATSEGYAYLLDLVTDAVETAGLSRRTSVDRARSWLGQALDTQATPATPQPGSTTLDTPAPPNTEPGGYPWAVIDALAERIELRIRGQFIPAPKWRATAVAGMIDALREAGILSEAETLPIQYAKFSTYYKCKVGAGRNGTTRIEWQKKARKDLGLI